MNIQFAFPYSQLPLWLAVAAVLLALMVLALRRLEHRRARRIDRFVESKLAPRLLVGYDERIRRPLFWFVAVGMAALLLALAQPRWGQSVQPTVRGSRDVVVLLDTSLSMLAANPEPSRMFRAKTKVEALLDALPGDRFGLIAFSGGAAIQCPLTLDHAYFRTILNVVNTDTISELGTNIEAAILEAREIFRKEDEELGSVPGSRTVLLVSDGEEVSGDAVRAAELIAPYATVNVMGIGDPDGAEITFPAHLRRFVADQTMPMTHISRLDEETLIGIAEASGGVYVRSVAHNGDIERIVEEINLMRARAVSDDMRLSMVNRYRWPLTLALLCFAGEGLWLVLMPHLRRWRMTRGQEVRHG